MEWGAVFNLLCPTVVCSLGGWRWGQPRGEALWTVKVLASEPLLGQESRAHRHASKRGDRPLSSRFQTVTCLWTVLIHSASIYLVAVMGLALSAPKSTSTWDRLLSSRNPLSKRETVTLTENGVVCAVDSHTHRVREEHWGPKAHLLIGEWQGEETEGSRQPSWRRCYQSWI